MYGALTKYHEPALGGTIFGANHAFGDLAYENLKEAELPVFDEEEMAFANRLLESVSDADKEKAQKL